MRLGGDYADVRFCSFWGIFVLCRLVSFRLCCVLLVGFGCGIVIMMFVHLFCLCLEFPCGSLRSIYYIQILIEYLVDL